MADRKSIQNDSAGRGSPSSQHGESFLALVAPVVGADTQESRRGTMSAAEPSSGFNPALLYGTNSTSGPSLDSLRERAHQQGELAARNSMEHERRMSMGDRLPFFVGQPLSLLPALAEPPPSASSTSSESQEAESDEDDMEPERPFWFKGKGKVPDDVWNLRNVVRAVKKNDHGYPIRQRLRKGAQLRAHFTSNLGHIRAQGDDRSPLMDYYGDLRFWDKRTWLYLRTDHDGRNLVNIPNESVGEERDRWEDYESDDADGDEDGGKG